MRLAADAAAPRSLGSRSLCFAALYSSWPRLRSLDGVLAGSHRLKEKDWLP